jgi:hypothetical protein
MRYAPVEGSSIKTTVGDPISEIATLSRRFIPPENCPQGLDATLSCRNASPIEFSLCLFRACLGKMIIFIYKWREKTRLLTKETASSAAMLTVCSSAAATP